MKYDFELELTGNNSLVCIIEQLKKNSTVLEFGPANGRLTRYMKEELNCEVYLIELDEEAGKQALKYGKDLIVGDIENYEWMNKYRDIKFDYIIFADVLEHLHNPEKVMLKARQLLKPEGAVILSVPNFAHNSIIINLLQNRFEYTSTGLLDNTHIHMFTKDSLENTLTKAGLVVSKRMATYRKVGENEIANTVEDIEGIDKSFWLSRDYGEVYQFVYVAKKGTEYIDEEVCDIKKQNANYYAQLFWGKEGITEDISTRHYLKDLKNQQKLCFSNIEHSGSLRFDPLNAPCVVEIESIVAITKGGTHELFVQSSNAKASKDNIYMFTTCDPVIEISVEGIEYIENLEIILKYISLNESQIRIISECIYQAIQESNEKAQIWKQERDSYKDAYMQKDMVLNQILNSKRWKILSLFRRPK